jgi:hypothetical protein
MIRKIVATLAASIASMAVAVVPAMAADTVVVTPGNTHGWYESDVRAGGEINFITDATSPYPDGALQLKTDGDTASKAQYMHDTSVPLADVTNLSYYTKHVGGPAEAAPSYQVAVDLNGSQTGGFTTLVYEPYWNGVVTPGVWQQWDVDQGLLWSSKSYTDLSGCTVTATPGGPPTYTLATLQSMCPDAVVTSFGVNVGTYNLNYNVETDGVTFNDVTYDFEVTNTPESKDACKNNGYKDLTDSDGNSFRNQGQCVSYFASQK